TSEGGVLVRGVAGVRAGAGGGGGGRAVRRSLPNMATSHLRHLSDAEFEAILQVARSEFYRLPQWRRNELKRRARLF
ncbi:unnamed protein product, partial [Leptidea sinapis]